MADAEFAPSDDPTPAEQLDALKKGLGRAVQWAAAGKLDLTDGAWLEVRARAARGAQGSRSGEEPVLGLESLRSA